MFTVNAPEVAQTSLKFPTTRPKICSVPPKIRGNIAQNICHLSDTIYSHACIRCSYGWSWEFNPKSWHCTCHDGGYCFRFDKCIAVSTFDSLSSLKYIYVRHTEQMFCLLHSLVFLVLCYTVHRWTHDTFIDSAPLDPTAGCTVSDLPCLMDLHCHSKFIWDLIVPYQAMINQLCGFTRLQT